MAYPTSYRTRGRGRSSSQGGARPRPGWPAPKAPEGRPGSRRPKPPFRGGTPVVRPGYAMPGPGRPLPWGNALLLWVWYEDWAWRNAQQSGSYWHGRPGSGWVLVNECSPSQVTYDASQWTMTVAPNVSILSTLCVGNQAFDQATGYPNGDPNYSQPGGQELIIWDKRRPSLIIGDRWANRFVYNRDAGDGSTGVIPNFSRGIFVRPPPIGVPDWWTDPISPFDPFRPPGQLRPQAQPALKPDPWGFNPEARPEGDRRGNELPRPAPLPNPRYLTDPWPILVNVPRLPGPWAPGRPRPDPGPGPGPGPSPGQPPALVTVIYPSGQASSRVGLHYRRTPKGKQKEVKARGKFARAIMVAVSIFGAFTETIDFMTALYRSLPENRKGPQYRTIEQKMRQLYLHATEIDFRIFIREYIKMQVGDMVIASKGQADKYRYQQSNSRGANQIGGSRLVDDPWLKAVERKLYEEGKSWSPTNVSDALVDIIFDAIDEGTAAIGGIIEG